MSDDAIDEEEFVLMNHMLDETLNDYRTHGICNYRPVRQAEIIYRNKWLRAASKDDLIALIAMMSVRLLQTEPEPPHDP